MSVIRDPEICRNVLEAMQTGVCVVDMQNKVLLWNDGAERITGYLRHEMVGRSFVDNLQQQCMRMKCEECQQRCPLISAMHTARPVEANAFIHHKAGHRTPVHVWAVPVRNERGAIIGAAQSFEHFRAIAAGSPSDRRTRDHTWLDEQTGVANRATVVVHLREALSAFLQNQVPFALLCIRVDEYEQVGAKCGKEAASSILRVVAQTLENTLRPTDLVGRWSEDQFLAILGGCQGTALPSVCDRVEKMISGGSIEWWGGNLSTGTLSIGSVAPVPEDSVDTLLARLPASMAVTSKTRSTAAGGEAGHSR